MGSTVIFGLSENIKIKVAKILIDNGLTSIVSDHSNPDVTDKHYTAKIEAAKKSINFRVFPKSEDGVN
jgi:hypothetical protein